MKKDLHRPKYHFTTENWMNDPNGLVYHNGEYHLYFQHNPNEAQWGNIHWGHAVSKDLVNWEYRKPALAPTNEIGEAHCFSGSIIVEDDKPIVFYTSIGFYKDDAALNAKQYMVINNEKFDEYLGENKVEILNYDIHKDMNLRHWRDPYVWKQDEVWYMVIGANVDGIGSVLLYKSDDLYNWSYIKNLYKNQDGYRILECPNFFKLQDKWVLVYSPCDSIRYCVGDVDSEWNFTVEQRGIIDNSHFEGGYAALTFQDDKNRRIMFSWLTELSRNKADIKTSWMGAQSLPLELTLDKNSRLVINPVKEVEKLRGEKWSSDNIKLTNKETLLPINGRALEIAFSLPVSLDDDREHGITKLSVFQSADKSESTDILFDSGRRMIFLDRSKSSHNKDVISHTLTAKILGEVNHVDIKVFIDHSIVEIFAGGQMCLTGRVYPMGEDSDRVSISNDCTSGLEIDDLSILQMSN